MQAPSKPSEASQASTRYFLSRGLRQLAWFRIVLVGVLLLAGLLLDVLFETARVSGVTGQFFLLLATMSAVLSVAYLAILPQAKDLEAFGLAQVAGDLAFGSFLVYATGGATSPFVFIYPLSALAAALLFPRRGAILVSLAGGMLFAAIAFLDYRQLLPPLPGRVANEGIGTPAELVQVVATNVAACIFVGVLGNMLARELRGARAAVEEREIFIQDLSRLNEAILQSLPSGLISTDSAGRIRSANVAVSEVLGVAPAVMIGRTPQDVAPNLEWPVSDGQSSSPGNGSTTRVERKWTRADGATLDVELSQAPLKESGGRVVGSIVSLRDMTHIRRMEESVRQAEHMAGIGRLAAAVAHELRNPLASISGSVELLGDRGQSPDEEKRLMEIVVSEVSRLAKLVDSLLFYARPNPSHRVPMDCSALVSDVLQVFREEATRSQISVRVDAPRGLRADGDVEQLRQVLWNLLRNAVEATGGGGMVEVRVEKFDQRIGISVRDTGPGIAKEAANNLFEPFFTTKQRGTGLGLATARRIVEEHGGTIEVESQSGKGAKFTVWLPASSEGART